MGELLPVLPTYTTAARDRMIREFLSGNGHPGCGLCGDPVNVRFRYAAAEKIRVEAECSGCGAGFQWTPPPATAGWSTLHLAYFRERREAGVDLRCPFDDCRVVTVEYSEHDIRFRCPFCGRSGAVPGSPA